jgi:hypothetical protein
VAFPLVKKRCEKIFLLFSQKKGKISFWEKTGENGRYGDLIFINNFPETAHPAS